MIYALKKKYSKISEIEKDILPAKEFSSMETSAGKMVESIALPEFGWEQVPSGMHTANSAIDGKKVENGILKIATLKSGPKCLNDEMSENFADAILEHCSHWAKSANVTVVEFTYGVLYGTFKESNKKDWHIIRNIKKKIGERGNATLIVHPENRLDCKFRQNGIDVSVNIRIGADWWKYLGGNLGLTILAISLVRACVMPGTKDTPDFKYIIPDLGGITSIPTQYSKFNSGIIQHSQIPWVLLFYKHFCNVLSD